MEKLITITEGGVQCDELGCNWKDTTAKDYSLWLNKPCPKCGKGVIITQEELEAMEHMNVMVDLINKLGEALRGKSNKLDKDKVIDIRRLLSMNESERKIAKLFNIGRGTVRCIKNGRTWSWL